jgi:2-alkyl-3-oxoalkanoate reductase
MTLALVTGGGGFLGSAIVRQLRERGDAVRTYSRHTHDSLAIDGIDQRCGDLADADAVADAVAGVDVVYHVAAKAGVWGPWYDYFRANVVGARNILAACRRHNVRHLVFTSSPSVTFAGTDQNGVDESAPYPSKFLAHYPHTKAIAEREVLAANGPELATVALRPHLIWGPGDPHLIPRIVEKARSGKLKQIGRAANLVDTIYVDNAATAHLQAADALRKAPSACAGKAYFLSQGEPQPLWDFINAVLKCKGLPPVTKTVPPWLAIAAGGLLEVIFRTLRLSGEPPMTRFVARQLSTAHWFDLTAARRDFGYAPAVSTEEGLRRLG